MSSSRVCRNVKQLNIQSISVGCATKKQSIRKNFIISVIITDFGTKFTAFTQENPGNICSKFLYTV